jgi:hypothetical protein
MIGETMPVVLLKVLMAMPAYGLDHETHEARAARMTIVAEAITQATAEATCNFGKVKPPDCRPAWPGSPVAMAVLLAATGRWESAFALHVHEGRCRLKLHECDDGHARGPWQLHPEPCRGEQCGWAVTKELVDRIVGADDDSTDAGAWGAMVKLTNGLRQCHTVRGAINYFARGGCADFFYTDRREELYLDMLKRYRVAERAMQAMQAEQ